MWTYLKNRWQTAQLQARYQRLMNERMLQFLEVSSTQPVSPDSGDWTPLGTGKIPFGETARKDLRTQARELVMENPHAKNLLRLLENYVVGPSLRVTVVPRDGQEVDGELLQTATRLWRKFHEENERHFSYREFARRCWRDGECFLRLFPNSNGPAAVRFVDPERIGATPAHPNSQGILTLPDDVETPLMYLRVDPLTGELQEQIPPEQLLHTKLGVDSNEKRGLTIFAPIIPTLNCFDHWREIELTARKLQASIVLWRKVQGGPSQVSNFADAAQVNSVTDPYQTTRRERYRPGTILTTSQGTDLEFLQPNTNFGDAVPLGRLLLLCIAAGAGLPEFMLTSDSSNANFASTMVAEGPAVKLFESEQFFFAKEFERLWHWVMQQAISNGELPPDFFDQAAPKWTFPQLVNRDRNQERLSNAKLAESKILSRAEVARRDGADPKQMQQEISNENASDRTKE